MSNKHVSPIIHALLSYSNVLFRNVNIYTYSIETPANNWIKNDKIFLSKYIVSHMSDYLRYLTMYKYGGIYFDLDVIIQKNLDVLPPNFSGAESDDLVAVGAIGFQMNGIGHKIAELSVRFVFAQTI